MSIRVGVGYDSHRFGGGRPLRLGGVTVPHSEGLVGHSDGDAILHAVTDAVLGAAALGDIGSFFPDSDPRWRGADSADLLRGAVAALGAAGWAVQQVDVTVIAERPRLLPHVPAMRTATAAALGVTPDAVSIKGKTNEGMGWVGRGEGIAVLAVATVTEAS